MAKTIYQIYDKIFKKILTLSARAVINLINGLFLMNYPLDSTISYNWTEFEDDELKKILADTIITINGTDSYHMEAQITEDDSIIFRVFQYGYSHANRNREIKDGVYRMHFPEPKIIYLCPTNAPDEYVLEIDYGSQGIFNYKVSTFKYLDIPLQELNQRRMVVLIPFQLLKLRDRLEKSRTQEDLEVLKNLIQNDIIGGIDENVRVGNITVDDARRLKRLTHKLYEHIYSHYEEMEELNEMTDESLMLDIDIIEKEHEKELAEKDKEIAEKDRTIAELEQERRRVEEIEKRAEEAEEENIRLREEIRRLKRE
mgnify:CR=1 FL=1